jgi:hypothetical protein
VAKNQQRLIDMFNSNPKRLHFTDPEVTSIVEENISFPLSYKKTKSAMEQNLETIRLKAKLGSPEDIDNKLLHLQNDTPLTTVAQVISNAQKLAQLKNCFVNYKKYVRPRAEEFLRYRAAQEVRKKKLLVRTIDEANKSMEKEEKLRRANAKLRLE